MVTERDICVLTTYLKDAGCSDVALAMEMALFSEESADLGEGVTEAAADTSDVSLGSLSLRIPQISSETKDSYRVIASSLLKNSSVDVQKRARTLLKVLG